MKPDFSIVIPGYNESANVEAISTALLAFASSVDYSLQIVFVDDGSVDDMVDRLQKVEWLGLLQTKILKLSRNYGSHAAIRAGIKYADADHVMIYSMDMPEPIADIDLFYRELKQGNEIVYSERIGYRGSLGSRIFARMVNRYIEESYPQGGLIGVGFGPKVKRELNNNIESSSSVFFQLFQLGFKKKGIAVEYSDRERGESKWTFGKKLKLFVDSFVMFSYAPIRAITALGMLLSFIGIVWALGIVIVKVFNVFDLAAGWPTTMSILLIGFGLTNFSLGVIAEYLVRTLEVARHRPVFIVDEIIDDGPYI